MSTRLQELKQESLEGLSGLALLLKGGNPHLYRHSARVMSLSMYLARRLDLPGDAVLAIGLAALFHDIGKMRIDEAILDKPSRLNRREFEVIKRHPAYGAEMLSRFKALDKVAALVYHHHERWDGDGYPDGLRGASIPLGARIIAIADAFEAITSHRIYQAPRTPLEALEELRRCAGTQFDAHLVHLFCTGLRPMVLSFLN